MSTTNKILENDYVKFELINGILKGTYKVKLVTLDIAKKIVQERLHFVNYRDIPILIADVRLKSIDRESRIYLSSPKGTKGLTASALVTRSPLTSHLANFFLKITISKNKIPARVFTSEKEALKWLNQYISN